MKILTTAFALCLSLLVGQVAQADTSGTSTDWIAQSFPEKLTIDTPQTKRDSLGNWFEDIDPFMGNLRLGLMLFNVPTNGDIPLSVRWNFNAQEPLESGIRYWRVRFGSDYSASANPVMPATLEKPDGTSEQLFFVSGSYIAGSTWRSASNFKLVCPTNTTNCTGYGPDGTTFTFNVRMSRQETTYPLLPGSATSDPSTYGIPVTYYYDSASTVTDRHGNTQTAGYSGLQLTSLTNTVDGKTIVINSDGQTGSVTYGNRTWSFNSTYAGQFPTQTIITQPDGLKWTFNYASLRPEQVTQFHAINQVTNPYGGVTNYAYNIYQITDQITPHCGNASGECGSYYSSFMRESSRPVMYQKTTSDGGAWTIAEFQSAVVPTPGSATAGIRTMTTPSGTITSQYATVYDSASSCTPWQIGLLLSKTTANPQGTVLQQESYNWQPVNVPGVGPQYIAGSAVANGMWGCSSGGLNFPFLATKTITRNGTSYTTTSAGADTNLRPSTVTETGGDSGAFSRTTTYSYDANLSAQTNWILNAVTQEAVSGSTNSGANQSSLVTRVFNSTAGGSANGDLLSETSNGVTISYTYWPFGKVNTKTDARGNTTTYKTYAFGTPQEDDQPGGVVLKRVVNTTYGTITSQTDGRGNTTSYSYDAMDRLAGITPAINNATTITYSSTTPFTRSAMRGNDSLVEQYDGYGRSIYTNHNGVIVNRSYDALGRKTFESYPSSTLGETSAYDALNRVTLQTHGDNSTVQYAYDPANYPNTVRETNERGFVVFHQNASYGDPDKGQLISTWTQGTEGAGVTIQRNLLGQIAKVTQNGKSRSYAYDGRYFLINRTDPETGTSTFGRDALGNMTSHQVAGSNTSLSTYDNLNRLKTVSNPAQNTSAVYSYDANSNVTDIAYGSTLHHWGFDANNNVIAETSSDGAKTFALSYYYNGNDAHDHTVYPSGRTVNYSPDAFGRPTQVGDAVPGVWYYPNGVVQSLLYANGTVTTQSLTNRQWIGQITTGKGVSGAGCTIGSTSTSTTPATPPTLQYDAQGPYYWVANAEGTLVRTPATFSMLAVDDDLSIPLPIPPQTSSSSSSSGGTTSTPLVVATRDGSGYLSSAPCATTGTSTAYLNRSYGYDGAGNVKTITDSAYPSANRTLDYDGLDRLTVANGSWGNGSIGYDNNGNITSQNFTGYSLSYNYDATSQKLLSVGGNQTFNYQYDVYGNVSNRGTGQSYGYDDLGNLVTVTGAKNYIYTYDGKGSRIRTQGPLSDKHQFYGGNNLIAEYDAYTGETREHLYLGIQKVADLIQQSANGTTVNSAEYYHADPVGSPIAATDKLGNLLWNANYYPYGYKLAGGVANENNKQWFGGKVQDDETGLQYFGARFYDPVVGRFAAMDPVDFRESNVQSFNSYAYANNNPFRYVDPDGRNGQDSNGKSVAKSDGSWSAPGPKHASNNSYYAERQFQFGFSFLWGYFNNYKGFTISLGFSFDNCVFSKTITRSVDNYGIGPYVGGGFVGGLNMNRSATSEGRSFSHGTEANASVGTGEVSEGVSVSIAKDHSISTTGALRTGLGWGAQGSMGTFDSVTDAVNVCKLAGSIFK
ncbi:RHS repeat domain-containing protein [Andreprevotia chitinilytica]|uniref:RHS repeat domain-containing protein n=1 Tax=Andreprevotia chitinilytica TaxID=396808 RepID=UPI000555568B|nr:RHS repeat-associated core domain-containing protein [Andreprevotia chitinilytica]